MGTLNPFQFQKQLRLQEARSLLLSESADAVDVAFLVGYESPSQFSREYSRMFGLSLKEDIKRLRNMTKGKSLTPLLIGVHTVY
ncbi:helix-turn-helix domain-containing protein [Priestia endophytica]|uniref:helix-turn-helix domain-containing protein n=1 Tax=Priestia endophytica TaxID=135735 RepID=UPI002E1BAF11|nr:AraC family transcriptional regulator [Priestia endophytica]